MAERSGGSVSYIDVSPAQLAALKPARTDVFNQFVVSPELAANRKPLDQPADGNNPGIKEPRDEAVMGAAQRETPRHTRYDRSDKRHGQFETMRAAFDDMNEHT